MVKIARKFIRWENIQGPRAVFAFVIGTALGAGLFPIAPGTMGALVAMPLTYYTATAPLVVRLLLWVGLLILGIWASKVFDETMGTSDNQSIVIDEVVGLGITAWTAGHHPKTLIAAFVLFRIFDILKPPPVRHIDRWSKLKASQNNDAAHWLGGFGVMMDDVIAGIQGLLVIIFLQYLGLLP